MAIITPSIPASVDAFIAASRADIDVVSLARKLTERCAEAASDAERYARCALHATTIAGATRWSALADNASFRASFLCDEIRLLTPGGASEPGAWSCMRSADAAAEEARAHLRALEGKR